MSDAEHDTPPSYEVAEILTNIERELSACCCAAVMVLKLLYFQATAPLHILSQLPISLLNEADIR